MQNNLRDLPVVENNRLVQIKESELKMLYKKIRDYELLLEQHKFDLDMFLHNKQQIISE